jgi:hypothetical protein
MPIPPLTYPPDGPHDLVQEFVLHGGESLLSGLTDAADVTFACQYQSASCLRSCSGVRDLEGVSTALR